MSLKAGSERHQEMATLTYSCNRAIEVFLLQNLLHADYKIDWNITQFQKKNHIMTTPIVFLVEMTVQNHLWHSTCW